MTGFFKISASMIALLMPTDITNFAEGRSEVISPCDTIVIFGSIVLPSSTKSISCVGDGCNLMKTSSSSSRTILDICNISVRYFSIFLILMPLTSSG